jgi:hypothetical protein
MYENFQIWTYFRFEHFLHLNYFKIWKKITYVFFNFNTFHVETIFKFEHFLNLNNFFLSLKIFKYAFFKNYGKK